VNWCPECATVLANEQVINGRCWRHEDTIVEQRDLEQWFLRITNYAQELLDGLTKLEGWPEKVRTMQRNWIGRSEGAEVEFGVEDASSVPEDERSTRDKGTAVLPASEDAKTTGDTITVFTTRIDTIYGATSIQLAPEHPLVKEFAAEDTRLAEEVSSLLEQQKKAREAGDIGEIEKHGVFTGHYAINPFNRERLPIWVGNYILSDYGTGAIMSVPAHDERDYEFAQKYGIEMRIVILPRRVEEADGNSEPESTLPYT
jgi:leucyl-tRNA synthetase